MTIIRQDKSTAVNYRTLSAIPWDGRKLFRGKPPRLPLINLSEPVIYRVVTISKGGLAASKL